MITGSVSVLAITHLKIQLLPAVKSVLVLSVKEKDMREEEI